MLALLAVLLLACSMFVMVPRAFADEEPAEAEKTEVAEEKKDDAADTKEDATDDADAAAQLIATKSDDLPAGTPEDAFVMGKDVVWFGDKSDFTECIIDNDIIGAGEIIAISGAKVSGSVRAAGRILSVSNAEVTENITMAGQQLKVENGTARVVALAGADVTFAGTAADLYAAGAKVVIDGVVTGDVHVYADTLEIGPNTVIGGTLYGRTNPNVTIDPGAVVGNNQLEIVEEQESNDDIMSLFNWPVIALSAASCLLIALLIEWIAGSFSASAAQLLKERPVSYLLSGILGIIFVPIALLLLCIPVVTIPAVIALGLVVIALLLISGGFVAALFARLLFPNKGRYITAGVLGIIFGALMAMPYVGYPLRLVGYIFTLGYSICAMRKGMTDRRNKRNEELIQF